MVAFEDESALYATVQMYGGLWAGNGDLDNEYYQMSVQRLNPYDDQFDLTYFSDLVMEEALQRKSVKEVLATKQRIPGLGNGVLQDILYKAKIHPKRKVQTLNEEEVTRLYGSVTATLSDMAAKGGRDTEKDLFGCSGGYKTKVGKFTVNTPCEICGSTIEKKSYMGGSIYYCPNCQKEL